MVHSRIGFVAGLVFLAGAVGAAQGQQGGLENRVTVLEKRMATVEGQVAAQGRQLEAVLSQLVELNDRKLCVFVTHQQAARTPQRHAM